MKKLIAAFRNFANAPKTPYKPDCLEEQTHNDDYNDIIIIIIMLLCCLRTFSYSRYVEPTEMRRRVVVAYLTPLPRHSHADIQENYKTSTIISPFRNY